jgi:hypothetical protein
MNLEHWCNDGDKGKRGCSKKNLSYCHFVHHKPHMNCSATEHGPLQSETGNHRMSLDMSPIVFLLAVTPCNEQSVYGCFGDSYYFYLQDKLYMALLLCAVCCAGT